MRILLFPLCLLLFSLNLNAQQTVDELLNEGIELHDAGKYDEALALYEEALKLDPANYTVLYEKSNSLMMLKKYDEATDLLKKVLKESKNPETRRLSYINYGTILDYKGQGKKSIKKYEEGLKEFPDSYLLWFNKGVTETSLNELKDAIESFQNAASNNPMHASSHNALAHLNSDKRIQAMMSLFTFLLIEPKGKRAAIVLPVFKNQLMKGVEKDGKTINITLDASAFSKKGPSEDDFSGAELILSLTASSSLADSLALKTEAEKLDLLMQMFCNAVVNATKTNDKGFYKNFYVPMFAELKKKDLVLTACHLVLSSADDPENNDWLNKNEEKVNQFYEWFKGYQWNK